MMLSVVNTPVILLTSLKLFQILATILQVEFIFSTCYRYSLTKKKCEKAHLVIVLAILLLNLNIMKTYFDSAIATSNGFATVKGIITSAYVGVGKLDESTGKRHVMVNISVFSEGHTKIIKLNMADFSRVLATHTDKSIKDEIANIVDTLRGVRDRNQARAEARAEWIKRMFEFESKAMEMLMEGKSMDGIEKVVALMKQNLLLKFNISSLEDEEDSERKLAVLNGQNILLWHRHLTPGSWRSIDGARQFKATKEFDEYVIDSMQSTSIEFDFTESD